jgi:chromate transport protein ChrA
MVATLAAAYVHFHGLSRLTAVTYGVNTAVIALISQSWWRLVQLGVEDQFQYVIATVALLATLMLPNLIANGL